MDYALTDAPALQHVFMSYSRKDEATMQRVAEFLRKQGINVWVDNEKLMPSTPIWEEEIERAIINAGAVVVLLSPDSKKSPWVRREIIYAEDNRVRIFPLLIAGNEISAVPIRLANYQRIDIRQIEKNGLNSLSTTLSLHLEELVARKQRENDYLSPTTTVARGKNIHWTVWAIFIGIAIFGFLWIGSLLFAKPETINYASELTSRAPAKPTDSIAENPAAITNATSTPTPKTASTAGNIPGGTVYAKLTEKAKYFYEDFDDNSSGWTTGQYENDYYVGSQNIVDGVYTWNFTEIQNFFFSRLRAPYVPSLYNFSLKVDARFVKSNDGRYCSGLIFRDDSASHYLFQVCDIQTFEIFYTDGNNWELLGSGRNSSIIQADGWNKVEVIAVSSNFKFYINDMLVDQKNDSRLKKGYVGLAIDIKSKEPGQIWFDNFEFEIR